MRGGGEQARKQVFGKSKKETKVVGGGGDTRQDLGVSHDKLNITHVNTLASQPLLLVFTITMENRNNK